MSSATATVWFGWFRPSKGCKWVKVAEGTDYGTVWNQLLDATAKQPFAEVLVSQTNPNDSPPIMRRRCF